MLEGRRTILYLGAFRFPDRNAAAARARANARLFERSGFRVILMGVGDGGAMSEGTLDGFRVLSFPAPQGFLGWFRYVIGRKDILRFIDRQADELAAVICYNYPAVAMLRIRGRGRRRGFRAVADATEWYDASGGSLLFRFVKWVDTTLRMRLVHRLMDGLITTSPVITEEYRPGGRPIVELPTLFDADSFPAPPTTVSTPPTFVYAGTPFAETRVNRARSNVKDRLDHCIVAFAEARTLGHPIRFEVYGVTRDQYLTVYPEHRSLLDRAGESVCFHGMRPNTEVRQAVAAADFTIFLRDPTRTVLAGFPTKLAESVCAGTPVITNALANVRHLEGAPEVWLVPAGKERQVVVRAASLGVEERQALKETCYRSRRFHWEAYTEQVRAFTRALFETSPSGTASR